MLQGIQGTFFFTRQECSGEQHVAQPSPRPAKGKIPDRVSIGSWDLGIRGSPDCDHALPYDPAVIGLSQRQGRGPHSWSGPQRLHYVGQVGNQDDMMLLRSRFVSSLRFASSASGHDIRVDSKMKHISQRAKSMFDFCYPANVSGQMRSAARVGFLDTTIRAASRRW
jgi:hypothetical protein